MQCRIYGAKKDIDKAKVNQFFQNRFSQENPLASVMVRGSADDDVADRRNENELKIFLDFFGEGRLFKIFDVGCGMGRWATNLINSINYYDGIDFTENYISHAKYLFEKDENINFFQMAATNINLDNLTLDYDLVIVNGLCVYLNDEDISRFFKYIPKMTDDKSHIYIRESISVMNERLTLKDFPSTELGVDYNAIYRTAEEYGALFAKHLPEFEILCSDLLLNKELGAREETNQRYWLLKKRHK